MDLRTPQQAAHIGRSVIGDYRPHGTGRRLRDQVPRVGEVGIEFGVVRALIKVGSECMLLAEEGADEPRIESNKLHIFDLHQDHNNVITELDVVSPGTTYSVGRDYQRQPRTPLPRQQVDIGYFGPEISRRQFDIVYHTETGPEIVHHGKNPTLVLFARPHGDGKAPMHATQATPEDPTRQMPAVVQTQALDLTAFQDMFRPL